MVEYAASSHRHLPIYPVREVLPLCAIFQSRSFLCARSASFSLSSRPTTMKDLARHLNICGAILLAHHVWAEPCYYPEDTIAGGHTPCTDGQHTACCYNDDDSQHDSCYSNGMCMSRYFGFLYRGSCTDPTFRDPDCPNQCLAGKS